jgi:nucleotide-binding universal stress UspA family protein
VPDAAPIVVGVDGSDLAVRAARWAGALAARMGTPLRVMTATPYLGHDLTDTGAALRAAVVAAHRERVEPILETAADAVRAENPAVAVTTASFTEPADEALVAASRTARLLVLGTADVTATGALLVGSTTLATLAHAACPVVAWRGESTTTSGHTVVVGVDGSREDGGALCTAFGLADRLGVELRVVRSWTLKGIAATVHRPVMVERDEWIDAQWRQLNELVDSGRRRHPGVRVTLIGEAHAASRALLLHSVGAVCVVVGSRRRNALTRGFFGSTSLNLLHHSEVPVVLCPFEQEYPLPEPADGIIRNP